MKYFYMVIQIPLILLMIIYSFDKKKCFSLTSPPPKKIMVRND